MFQFKQNTYIPMDYMRQCYNLFSTFPSLNISPLEDQICFDVLEYDLRIIKRKIDTWGYYDSQNTNGHPMIVVNPWKTLNKQEEIFLLLHELVHFRDDIYDLRRSEAEIDLSAYATMKKSPNLIPDILYNLQYEPYHKI